MYDAVLFDPCESACGGDLTEGVQHTVVSLEPGAVFYETKTGLYVSIAAEDMATWVQAEGSNQAGEYLRNLVHMVPEDNHR